MANNLGKSFNFVHLSDVHVGADGTNWLWPSFKKAFLDDLRTAIEKVESIDLVVFSGDLTNRGASNEYIELTKILSEVWGVFSEFGCSPILFATPGNHDLVRPDSAVAAKKALDRWWEDQEVQESFWSKKPAEYFDLVREAFSGFDIWLNSLSAEGILTPPLNHGTVPGDASAVIKFNGKNIGLVGLNSAWLQLDGKNLKERLHVDTRQLLHVTENDPDVWCSKNDFNFLITHHPSNWLHPKSLDAWRSDIYTPSRFDGHIYGHMHEQRTTSISEGGAANRLSIQAMSLFGLEKVNELEDKRNHGYTIFQLSPEEDDVSILRQWPRRAVVASDGVRKIIADYDLNVCDAGFLDHDLRKKTRTKNLVDEPVALISTELRPVRSLDSLRGLCRILPPAGAFKDVRRVDFSDAKNAFEKNRCFWLVSDWGLGADEFIYELEEDVLGKSSNVYEINLQNYFTRNEILDGIQGQIFCSLAQLCELISLENGCILILDDVRICEGRDQNTRTLQKDIEYIVGVVLSYCKNANIVIKSRCLPANCAFDVITLRPFDEVDTGSYVKAHSLGGNIATDSKIISKIFRHTGGVPVRIDSVLNDVKIVGIGGIAMLNTDIASKGGGATALPPGLVNAIDVIKKSQDPSVKRAYNLMKALAMFPCGEQLETVKRFFHGCVFYPQDARILMESAFVDAVEIPSVGGFSSADSGRALVVRRPVREYLYASFTPGELKNLSRTSLTMYFGDKWSVGDIKQPRGHKFDDRRCGSWQIGNASLMVLRTVQEATESLSLDKIKAAYALTCAYCALIYKGDHYGSIASLCSDALPLFERVDIPAGLVLLQIYFIKALRMTGEREGARDVGLSIKAIEKPKNFQQEILLQLALCCESLNDSENAIEFANECLGIDSKNHLALQAKSIVIGLSSEESGRIKNLQKLELDARKRKAYIVANNIALKLASESKDSESSKATLSKMVESSAMEGDHHNAMRAMIDLAEVKLKEEGVLGSKDLSRVIDAYHYLYSEGLKGSFDKCHRVLWRAFEAAGESNNLLRLFRHSSLIWRLRNKLGLEKENHEKLIKILGSENTGGGAGVNREMTYFLSRTSHIMITNTEAGVTEAVRPGVRS